MPIIENIQNHKHLFWDTNLNEIDAVMHARFIIERVVTRGNLSDWQWMHQLYQREIIIQKIQDIRFLDKKTLQFLSVIYEIPKEKFRCYS